MTLHVPPNALAARCKPSALDPRENPPSRERPLAHKTALTLANEVERRGKRRHALVVSIMADALPGEGFSDRCTRLGRENRLYQDWLIACIKEGEALRECKARYGEAVRYASAWPAYIVKVSRTF